MRGDLSKRVDFSMQRIARDYVREHGGPTKVGIHAFAQDVGVSERRARAFYFREACAVRADEFIAALRAFARLERHKAAQQTCLLVGEPARPAAIGIGERHENNPGASRCPVHPDGGGAQAPGTPDPGDEVVHLEVPERALAWLNGIAERLLERGEALLDPPGGEG